MTHRYVTKQEFKEEVKKHDGVYTYCLQPKDKHGEQYLGSLGNIDFLDESIRGGLVPQPELVT